MCYAAVEDNVAAYIPVFCDIEVRRPFFCCQLKYKNIGNGCETRSLTNGNKCGSRTGACSKIRCEGEVERWEGW